MNQFVFSIKLFNLFDCNNSKLNLNEITSKTIIALVWLIYSSSYLQYEDDWIDWLIYCIKGWLEIKAKNRCCTSIYTIRIYLSENHKRNTNWTRWLNCNAIEGKLFFGVLLLGARGQLRSIRNALPMRHRNVLKDVRDCIVRLVCDSLAIERKIETEIAWKAIESVALCVLSIAMPGRWGGKKEREGRGGKGCHLIACKSWAEECHINWTTHTQRLGLRRRSRSKRSRSVRWRRKIRRGNRRGEEEEEGEVEEVGEEEAA